MRKLALCICKSKDADQLRGNCEADQRLCFRYTDSTIPLLPKFQASSHLVGNPENRFSHKKAQIADNRIVGNCKTDRNSYRLPGIDFKLLYQI